MKIKTTFKQFLRTVNESATRHNTAFYFGEYDDLSNEYKAVIKEQYHAIERFVFINQAQLEAQVKVFGLLCLGVDTKAGDLVWSDGQRLWSRERFADQDFSIHGSCPDWLECALLVRNMAIVSEFDLYQESLIYA